MIRTFINSPTGGFPWVELRKPQMNGASQWGKRKQSRIYQVCKAKTHTTTSFGLSHFIWQPAWIWHWTGQITALYRSYCSSVVDPGITVLGALLHLCRTIQILLKPLPPICPLMVVVSWVKNFKFLVSNNTIVGTCTGVPKKSILFFLFL